MNIVTKGKINREDCENCLVFYGHSQYLGIKFSVQGDLKTIIINYPSIEMEYIVRQNLLCL